MGYNSSFMSEIPTELWMTLAAVAIAFLVLGLTYSFVKYERLMRLARSGGGGVLAPREALLLAIARRLAVGGGGSGSFSVLLVEWPASPESDARERSRERVRRHRASVRRSDDLMLLDETRMGAVLDLNPAKLGVVLDRWRAMAGTHASPAGETSSPASCAFGIARYPEDAESASGLIEAAERELAAAALRAPGLLVGDLPEAVSSGEQAVIPPAELEMLDPLTGILRQEKMGSAARKFIARCRRDGRPVSVLYIDIDRLEGIQARLGREAGDAVLKTFADVLSQSTREADLVGRMEGSAFFAILECAPAQAEDVVRRVVDRARDSAARLGTIRIPFAVCVGIAGIGGSGSVPAHVLEAAETALDYARRQGPNTWVVYDRNRHTPIREEKEIADVF